MNREFVDTNFESYLAVDEIVCLDKPSSQPAKRAVKQAIENNLLIDLTHGRRTRCLVYLSSGHIVMLSISPRTLINRIKRQRAGLKFSRRTKIQDQDSEDETIYDESEDEVDEELEDEELEEDEEIEEDWKIIEG